MSGKKLITRCLDALNKVKKDAILESDMNKAIDLSINKIESIMSNNKVKIAILGEFSSGKSTFINAFLRNSMLSYADEPTTAINTYITYGDKEKTTIYYNDGSSKIVNLKNLEMYTKEGKVGKSIDKVSIEYNNECLKKGITIIDTPGANIDNKRHNIQRDKAIDECSIGIFLISVKSLTSKSFMDFLKKHEDKLGKFIFVISKCDTLEDDIIDVDTKNENKLDEVINYVKECIKKHSKLENPKVYPISAYYFLNDKSSKILNVKKSFLDLEKEIEEINEKEREVLILLEMLKVLKQICPQIKDILSDKNKLCEYEIKKVNGEIEGFDRFIYNEYTYLKKSLIESSSEEKKRLIGIINSLKKNYLNRTSEEINSLSSMYDIKDKINNISTNGVNGFKNASNNEIMKGINRIGTKEFKKIEYDFKDYFLNLQRTYKILGIERALFIKRVFKNLFVSLLSFLASKVTLEVLFYFINDTYYNFYWTSIPFIVAIIMLIVSIKLNEDKIEYHVPYTRSTNNVSIIGTNVSRDVSSELTATHGLGLGAAVGVFVGGPVGALIGAGIGAVASSFLLSGRVETIKGEVIEAIKVEMDNVEARVNSSIDNVARRKRKAVLDEYKNYVGENISLYRELLDGIYKYNNNKFIGLSTSNNILKNYLKEFESINKDIDNTLSKVVNKCK